MNFVAATLLLLSVPATSAESDTSRSSADTHEASLHATERRSAQEEKAFWVLCCVIEDILPDYYTHDMLAIQSDATALTGLVEAQLPDLMLRMDELCVIPNVFCVEWFMKIYVTILPLDTALRIWDCLCASRSLTPCCTSSSSAGVFSCGVRPSSLCRHATS